MKTNPKHTPPHLFLDNTPYFITAAIYKKRPLLKDPATKNQLLDLIQTTLQTYQWTLDHWVILDNHYHWLGLSHQGRDLSKIIHTIHTQSGYYIRQKTNCAKPVWWNYWDYCPRHDKDYQIRLNYLLNNPVKHGYVDNLHDYPFSSFHTIFAKSGQKALAWQFRQYPEYKTLVLREAYDDDF